MWRLCNWGTASRQGLILNSASSDWWITCYSCILETSSNFEVWVDVFARCQTFAFSMKYVIYHAELSDSCCCRHLCKSLFHKDNTSDCALKLGHRPYLLVQYATVHTCIWKFTQDVGYSCCSLVTRVPVGFTMQGCGNFLEGLVQTFSM